MFGFFLQRLTPRAHGEAVNPVLATSKDKASQECGAFFIPYLKQIGFLIRASIHNIYSLDFHQ